MNKDQVKRPISSILKVGSKKMSFTAVRRTARASLK